MYCAYCFSEDISSEQLNYTTGVRHAGVSEHWNETAYDCQICGDETSVIDELPAANAEDYDRVERIWRLRETPTPAHVCDWLMAYEDSLPVMPWERDDYEYEESEVA